MFLFIADVHIKLGQKNVPKEWQRARFLALADEINKIEHKTLIIGGDLLDVADPSLEEVGLLYEFLRAVKAPVVLIPGNHELVSKTKDCYSYIESMLLDLDVLVIRDFTSMLGMDFIPYNILHNKSWPSPTSKIAVTHVRGEIPPHVVPEIDLDRFNHYDTVFAGDLHARSNSQRNIVYPGSPMVTSFHRNRSTKENGAFLINEDLSYEWIEFDLPQLIRKSVSSESEILPTHPDHTIYELHGSLEELSKVKSADLLDKKVTESISSPATLNMTGDIVEELVTFLTKIKKVENTEGIVALFKEIVNDSN